MKDICEAIKHLWDEFHMYEVVCSRCRECRPYTDEDRANLSVKLSIKIAAEQKERAIAEKPLDDLLRKLNP